MTVKPRSSTTASELRERLQSSAEFLEKNKANEKERSERARRIQVEQEPILAELRDVGLKVQSVWDLVNDPNPYPEAIPLLLRHLTLPYSDVVKEGIARALAVPEPQVQNAWNFLVSEYRAAPIGWGRKGPGDSREFRLGAKDGLACALSASVTEDRLPDLIALTKDSSLGESRILLLSALKKRRKSSDLVQKAIAELTNDPVLRKEISTWISEK